MMSPSLLENLSTTLPPVPPAELPRQRLVRSEMPQQAQTPGTPVISTQRGLSTPKDKSRIIVRLHSVQPGETLTAISERYSIPSEAIKMLNQKSTDTLFADEVLYLPSSASLAAQPSRIVCEGDDLAYIQLTPRAKLMLRKIEAEASAAAETMVAQKIQGGIEAPVHANAAEANVAAPAGMPAGTPAGAPRVSAQNNPQALFASVQAAPRPDLRHLYGGVHHEYAPGVAVGQASMALGAGMIMLGSASMLRAFLKALVSVDAYGVPVAHPDSLLARVSDALQSALQRAPAGDVSTMPRQQDRTQSPAFRAAKRYLEELKRGNGGSAFGDVTGQAASGKLGIPTGDAVALRRTQGSRDLVVDLRRKDSSGASGTPGVHQNSLTSGEEAAYVVEMAMATGAWNGQAAGTPTAGPSRMLPEGDTTQVYWLAAEGGDNREPSRKAPQPMAMPRGGTATQRGDAIAQRTLLRQRVAAGLPYGTEWPMGNGAWDDEAAALFSDWDVRMAKEANRMASLE